KIYFLFKYLFQKVYSILYQYQVDYMEQMRIRFDNILDSKETMASYSKMKQQHRAITNNILGIARERQNRNAQPLQEVVSHEEELMRSEDTHRRRRSSSTKCDQSWGVYLHSLAMLLPRMFRLMWKVQHICRVLCASSTTA
ncbi:hypothetical protein Pfo_018993, partial [Paulownia fortunei]